MRKPSDLVIGGKGMIAERKDVIVRSSREKGFSQMNRWKQTSSRRENTGALGIAIVQQDWNEKSKREMVKNKGRNFRYIC